VAAGFPFAIVLVFATWSLLQGAAQEIDPRPPRGRHQAPPMVLTDAVRREREARQRELDLRERELAAKERELEVRERELEVAAASERRRAVAPGRDRTRVLAARVRHLTGGTGPWPQVHGDRGALRAAVLVAAGGLGEVDAGQVGERDQPRQHVGELLDPLVVALPPDGAGQLADLLDEPGEGAVDAAGAVLLAVGGADRAPGRRSTAAPQVQRSNARRAAGTGTARPVEHT
jgi:hypothetical protein